MANHEYRIQRGRILKILYKAYPGDASDRVISLTLNDIHLSASSGVLKGHISYLADRGLISSEDVTNPDLGIDFIAKLTAKGVDFVEKDVSDNGIDLGV